MEVEARRVIDQQLAVVGPLAKGLINLYARRFKEWDSHKKSKSDAAERMCIE